MRERRLWNCSTPGPRSRRDGSLSREGCQTRFATPFPRTTGIGMAEGVTGMATSAGLEARTATGNVTGEVVSTGDEIVATGGAATTLAATGNTLSSVCGSSQQLVSLLLCLQRLLALRCFLFFFRSLQRFINMTHPSSFLLRLSASTVRSYHDQPLAWSELHYLLAHQMNPRNGFESSSSSTATASTMRAGTCAICST